MNNFPAFVMSRINRAIGMDFCHVCNIGVEGTCIPNANKATEHTLVVSIRGHPENKTTRHTQADNPLTTFDHSDFGISNHSPERCIIPMSRIRSIHYTQFTNDTLKKMSQCLPATVDVVFLHGEAFNIVWVYPANPPETFVLNYADCKALAYKEYTCKHSLSWCAGQVCECRNRSAYSCSICLQVFCFSCAASELRTVLKHPNLFE